MSDLVEANKSTKTDLAVTDSTAIDYGEYSKMGFEDVSFEDISIPFLNILQSNSKELDSIEGAKVGDMYNSVTKELYQSVVIVPVFYQTLWVEWVPRTKGGGFVGVHEVSSDVVLSQIASNGGSKIPPKGQDGKRISFKCGENELVETHYMYALMLDSEGEFVEGMCVIPFTSTKIKVFKNWLSSMMMLRQKPPIFANRAKISTVMQTSPAGKFFNYSISPLRKNWISSLLNPANETEKIILATGLEFREQISSGKSKVDYSNTASDDEPLYKSASEAKAAVNSEDPPF